MHPLGAQTLNTVHFKSFTAARQASSLNLFITGLNKCYSRDKTSSALATTFSQ